MTPTSPPRDTSDRWLPKSRDEKSMTPTTDPTALDLQRMRDVAEKATHQANWQSESPSRIIYSDDGFIVLSAYAEDTLGRTNLALLQITDDDRRHIATFDPPTILRLLDRIEGLEGERESLRNSFATRGELIENDPLPLWMQVVASFDHKRNALQSSEADNARLRTAIKAARGLLLYPLRQHLDDHARFNTDGILAVADTLLAVESELTKPDPLSQDHALSTPRDDEEGHSPSVAESAAVGALPALPETPSLTGWLIEGEMPDGSPGWMTLKPAGAMWGVVLTKDSTEALRFPRRIDAEDYFACHLDDAPYRITEHRWG